LDWLAKVGTAKHQQHLEKQENKGDRG
jgi:hypothetical protein